MGSQQFCLKWNNHQSNLLNVFDQLLQNEAFVDVTIACEGLSLKAHKMVLSACSPYFQTLFLENPCKHPIVILNSIKYSELKAIIDFMYKGEVNVSQERLSALLKTAEMLKVKGLAEVTNQTTQSLNMQMSDAIPPVPASSPPVQLTLTHNHRGNSSPPPKRKKLRQSTASSATNSTQNSTPLATNSAFTQPKNASVEHSMSLDPKTESHLPVAVEHSQDEHTKHDDHSDQSTMDLPPKLLMESSTENTEDHSSVSNITSDLAFDQPKSEQPSQEHPSPPDITSGTQPGPSTSGLQAGNQENENIWAAVNLPRRNQRYRVWTQETMERAIMEVVFNGQTISSCSTRFKIPFETLRRYVIRVRQTSLENGVSDSAATYGLNYELQT